VELAVLHRPEVVFLDIRMPGITGVEAAHQILQHQRQAGAAWPTCELVFVTAYDQYALDAFNQGALDYLLKPVSAERLRLTWERVLKRLDSRSSAGLLEKIEALAQQLAQRPSFLKWIPAATGSTLEMWPVEQVLFFAAEDKYTRAATPHREALLRKSIRELAAELDPEIFWQIHRGTLINARAIEKVHRSLTGTLSVTLRGSKERFEVSRTHAARFKSF
jgi:DNA-binding LytR/AlgR family response regulator